MRRWILVLPFVLAFSLLAVVSVAAGEAAAPGSAVLPRPSAAGRAGPVLQATTTPVTSPLLLEGFEDWPPSCSPGPQCWRTQVLTADSRYWEGTATRARSGAHSIYHDDNFGPQDAWLVTPRITPTEQSELVFWQLDNYWDLGRYEKHSVWVSAGNGDPKYQEFVQLAETAPGAEETWEEVRLSLVDYAGQPIYLAFRYEGDYADEWFIDDVEVTSGLFASHDGPKPPGAILSFTAYAPVGDDVTYQWDFGAGVTKTGSLVTHTYGALGDYTAVVTASNSVSWITRTLEVPIRTFVYLPLVLRQQ